MPMKQDPNIVAVQPGVYQFAVNFTVPNYPYLVANKIKLANTYVLTLNTSKIYYVSPNYVVADTQKIGAKV